MASETRLAEVSEIIMGQSPPGSTYDEQGEGLPFYQGVADFNYRHPSPRVYCSAPSRKARPGDILISVRAPIGRINVANHECAIGRGLSIIRANDKVDSRFLEFVLRFLETSWEAIEGSGSVFGNATRDDLEALIIPWPQKGSERYAIAHILGTLDDKIELNRRMSETLEAMARALFKSWFVDFDPVRAKMEGRWRKGESLPGLPAHLYDLFPNRLVDSELSEIPEGWEVASVYEVVDVVYGAPFASGQFNNDGIGEPLIRIRDLVNESPGVWTPETHPKGYKVRAGDIVVGMDGEFRAHLWGGPEGWLNQRICVFKPKSGWTAAFVRNAIIEPLAYIEATETATTVIHLGKADIDLFTVVLPRQGVADLFNRACQPWYDRIVSAKQESRALGALRDALLPKLISGELGVKDAEKFMGRVQQ